MIATASFAVLISFAGCSKETTTVFPEANQSNGLYPTVTPSCPSPYTFGYTGVGGSTSASYWSLHASRFQLLAPATIFSIVVYMDEPYDDSSYSKFRLGIYTDSAGFPATLLGQSGSLRCNPGWNEADVPDVPLAAGNFWLAVGAESSCGDLHYATGAVNTGIIFNGAGFLPAFYEESIFGDTRNNFNYSIYARFCP